MFTFYENEFVNDEHDSDATLHENFSFSDSLELSEDIVLNMVHHTSNSLVQIERAIEVTPGRWLFSRLESMGYTKEYVIDQFKPIDQFMDCAPLNGLECRSGESTPVNDDRLTLNYQFKEQSFCREYSNSDFEQSSDSGLDHDSDSDCSCDGNCDSDCECISDSECYPDCGCDCEFEEDMRR